MEQENDEMNHYTAVETTRDFAQISCDHYYYNLVFPWPCSNIASDVEWPDGRMDKRTFNVFHEARTSRDIVVARHVNDGGNDDVRWLHIFSLFYRRFKDTNRLYILIIHLTLRTR